MGCKSSKDSEDVVDDWAYLPNFKIVFVGDCQAGKSALFKRYIFDKFEKTYKKTENFSKKTCQINLNGLLSTLTIIDIASDLDFEQRRSCYKNIDAAIVVVDASDKNAIYLANTWKKDVERLSIKASENVSLNTSFSEDGESNVISNTTGNVPVILIATKSDLLSEQERDIYAKKMGEFSSNAEFFMCRLVSAAEEDSNVSDIINYIPKYFTKLKVAKTLNSTQPQQSPRERPLLMPVELPEINILFKECEICLKSISGLNDTFKSGISGFMQLCYKCKIGALHMSVTGHLKVIESSAGNDCSLVLVDNEDVLKIEPLPTKKHISPIYKSAIQHFNINVLTKSKEILRSLPRYQNSLIGASRTILKKSKKIWEMAIMENQSMDKIKESLSLINKNQELISDGQDKAIVLLKDVDSLISELKDNFPTTENDFVY